jgi:hypothetical protein|eukprot:scaffold3774_cov137-Alexandrium_tamarense.AAC.3
MAECVLSSVTASAKQALIADRGQYTFDGTIYAQVLFKHMMKVATLDNKVTSKWLHDQLKQMVAVMLEFNCSSSRATSAISSTHWTSGIRSSSIVVRISMTLLIIVGWNQGCPLRKVLQVDPIHVQSSH